MYNKLCYLRIKTRLFLIISIAVAGFLVMASITLIRYNSAANTAKNFRELAELAPSAGQLIHELQKERGATALYLNSTHSHYTNETLYQQKEKTDQAVTNFINQIKSNHIETGGEKLNKAITETLEKLKILPQTRTEITSFTFPSSVIPNFYTELIRLLMTVISEMSQLSDNSLITTHFIAYESFMEAKEYMGQERALGAIGFATGKFEYDLYRQFVTLIARQDAALHVFTENAAAVCVAFAEKTLSGKPVNDHLALRQVAFNNFTDMSTRNVSGIDWYETITVRIDLMKQVEDHLITQFSQLNRDVENTALQNFIILSLGVLAISTIIISGAYLIARSIS